MTLSASNPQFGKRQRFRLLPGVGDTVERIGSAGRANIHRAERRGIVESPKRRAVGSEPIQNRIE